MSPAGPELDADRTLALSYVPAARREALGALWQLDIAMGAVLAGGTEPLISQIKLTWWRDSLIKLDTAKPPAEPVLENVARHVLPAGVSGEALSGMEEGWTALLSPDPLGPSELQLYARARGGGLFRHAARILGSEPGDAVEQAGEAWALVDLARHSNAADAAAALAQARERLLTHPGFRWPGALRPLGMLGALARRDAERELDAMEPPGAPARMLRMLRHRFSGR